MVSGKRCTPPTRFETVRGGAADLADFTERDAVTVVVGAPPGCLLRAARRAKRSATTPRGTPCRCRPSSRTASPTSSTGRAWPPAPSGRSAARRLAHGPQLDRQCVAPTGRHTADMVAVLAEETDGRSRGGGQHDGRAANDHNTVARNKRRGICHYDDHPGYQLRRDISEFAFLGIDIGQGWTCTLAGFAAQAIQPMPFLWYSCICYSLFRVWHVIKKQVRPTRLLLRWRSSSPL